uniref:ATP synthase subunit s, mitochondrial n=1 Tax=Syphacia muris TaxID=451379 RepID=A0A0N5AI71_9BILA
MLSFGRLSLGGSHLLLSEKPFRCQQRFLRSIRRVIAELTSNTFHFERVAAVGPDLACLEWLLHCGATKVVMSDGSIITGISSMKKYISSLGFNVNSLKPPCLISPECSLEQLSKASFYNARWSHAPSPYILKVDASDSAIADPGFFYFRECRGIEELVLNFCDYFTDEGIRILATGRTVFTLKNLEIVMNSSMSDASLYWLIRMKSLQRMHMYFLPYVTNPSGVLRQLKLALPKCKVTFPPVGKVGYGY